MSATIRLTVGQAIVKFLAHQFTERDGVQYRMFAGCFGIFGHGNVAGVGQALLQAHHTAVAEGFTGSEPGPEELPYFLARHEQAMVHAAVAFARTTHRMQMFACTTSIGPGATNMVTGAALATINHLPVLLLPSDVFASRIPDPVLQQLEYPGGPDVTVNDCFRPVSRYFDRIWRPEQLIPSAIEAMRVLADPAETGAVTLCLPQDVQAESWSWPEEFFRDRIWHISRPNPDRAAISRATEAIRAAQRPLIIAGGGVRHSQASSALVQFATATGIPVADTQAGKGGITWGHPGAVGGIGSTGTAAANTLAHQADVVIGIGTRYSDFTTASHTVFKNPEVTFVNINISAFDAAKHSGTMVVSDAQEALDQLTIALSDYRVAPEYSDEVARLIVSWNHVTEECFNRRHTPLPAQTEVLGVLNTELGAQDILINAAGSMPGDLQALWQAASADQYHVEYGYSCMGYEIPAALGAKLARPDARVVAVVGDGTYQMMPQEIATLVAEGIAVVIVIIQNHGFASIGALSESRGSQRFGTQYRKRNPLTRQLDGGADHVDLVAHARSLGAEVLDVRGIDEFRDALRQALEADVTTVVHIHTDPLAPNPPSSAWWDVPVAEVSALSTTQEARREYTASRGEQRYYV